MLLIYNIHSLYAFQAVVLNYVHKWTKTIKKENKMKQQQISDKNKLVPGHFTFFSSDSLKDRLLVKSAIAPAVAALIDKVVTHPLDTVITYQQKNNTNFVQTSKYIFNNYGLLGFYRGLSLPLFLSAPLGGILVYGSYEGLKEFLAQSGIKNKTVNSLSSSVATSLFFAVVATPFESKRVRDTFKIVVENQKNKLLYHYRGFLPMSLKFLLHAPIVLAGTDILKDTVNHYGTKSENPTIRNFSDAKNPYTAFFGGLLTGVFSQLITTPVDVVKTNVMSDYNTGSKRLSLWQHATKAYKEKSLFQSTGSRVVKFGMHSSVMLGFMHMVNNYFIDKTQRPEFIHEEERTGTKLSK